VDAALVGYVIDWLHLGVRWLHIIAAIAWVGASFYFIALDYSLRPPVARAESEGVGGESWEIHGGGFYRIDKFRLAPAQLPASLRWFKWEAYTTWLSGFALLVLLYYVDAGVTLVDPNVLALDPWLAIAASVVLIGASWIAYDQLARRLAGGSRELTAAIVVLVIAVTWIAAHLFSSRAAYIEVGAALGTWMAANVFFVIIPGQRELVAAAQAGREPEPRYAAAGKQRSVDNNYLTLPVLFAMISQHFPFTYANPNAWLVLLGLMGIGATVRHFFNLRHQGRLRWGVLGAALVAAVALAVAIAPNPSALAVAAGPSDFGAVRGIVGTRCILCHTATPAYPGILTPPRGLAFDDPAVIRQQASAIYEQVVVARRMPLGNVTRMTDDERAVIARWFAAGAPEH
jgi:uncharacterized membrane protein